MKQAFRITPREVAAMLDRLRPELERFLHRLVVRVEAVDEILAVTRERALAQASNSPRKDPEMRIWLWRIATGIAESEWTARPEWREADPPQAIRRARADMSFLRDSEALRGSAETSTVARDHLAFCLSLTIAQLPSRHALALHLFNLGDFSSADIAEILTARVAQVQRWSSEAREAVEHHLGKMCGLTRNDGPCRQCVLLDIGFAARRGDPLAGTNGSLDARLEIVRRIRENRPDAWHRRLASTLDSLAEPGSRKVADGAADDSSGRS